MKQTLIFAFVLLQTTLFAQNGNYVVKGEVGSVNAPATIYLSHRTPTGNVLDSTALNNGHFEFKGSVSDPVKSNLILNYKGYGTRGKSVQSILVYLEAGEILISSPDSLSKAKISGSKVNEDNERLNQSLKPILKQMSDISTEYYAMPKEKQQDTAVTAGLSKRFTVLNDKKRQALVDFIKANPGSVISVDALKSYGGSIPDYAEVGPLFEGLSAETKNSGIGKAYAADLEKMKATAIGAIAPEFTQNDPDGKPVKLSDFKGKYVLVDFWASWCGPCRAENPNVVAAYQKYHDKGFNILGVSLDNEKGKENWSNAIKKDGLNWTQVSDLKYWNNEVAQQYGIRSIPQNLLLDPNGKIVGKNLRGKALETKLEELFK